MNFCAISGPSTSIVTPMNTSKFTWPLWILASASSIVLNVETWTLQLYFFAKLLTTAWLMYATQL